MKRFSKDTELWNREQENDRIIDQILSSNLPMDLPANFPDMIMAKVNRRLLLKQNIQEFLIYAAVTIAGLAAGATTLFIYGNGGWDDWVRIITMNVSPGVQAILVILFILLFDRVVLPMLGSKYRKRTETLTS
jgi:hypothetical protein